MPCLTITHKQALLDGRRRAYKRRHAEAIRRVNAWQQWLRAGSPIRSIPEVPTDADYRHWRAR